MMDGYPRPARDESASDSHRRAALETESKLALYGSLDKWPTLLLGPGEFYACGCGHHRAKHTFDMNLQRAACSVKKCECTAFVFPSKAARS